MWKSAPFLMCAQISLFLFSKGYVNISKCMHRIQTGTLITCLWFHHHVWKYKTIVEITFFVFLQLVYIVFVSGACFYRKTVFFVDTGEKEKCVLDLCVKTVLCNMMYFWLVSRDRLLQYPLFYFFWVGEKACNICFYFVGMLSF